MKGLVVSDTFFLNNFLALHPFNVMSRHMYGIFTWSSMFLSMSLSMFLLGGICTGWKTYSN